MSLFKARVKAHQRGTPSGGVTQVESYTTLRPGSPHPTMAVAPSSSRMRSRAAERGVKVPPMSWGMTLAHDPNAKLQATWIDAKGRRQYGYHPDWVATQQAKKFSAVRRMARTLPRIRDRYTHDLQRPDADRRRVAAGIVALIDKGQLRVGSELYARQHGTFGAASLRKQHVKVTDTGVTVNFPGKHGVVHTKEIISPELIPLFRHLASLPGERLFQYHAADGEALRPMTERDVQQYLRPYGITPKYFRTWHATQMVAERLAALPKPVTEKVARQNINTVIKAVAKELGHTPAICRSHYVNPAVLDAYHKGKLNPRNWMSKSLKLSDPDWQRLLMFLELLLERGDIEDRDPFPDDAPEVDDDDEGAGVEPPTEEIRKARPSGGRQLVFVKPHTRHGAPVVGYQQHRAHAFEPVSYMRVQGAEGETRAAAGMDPRLMRVLGGNLYSGDLGQIAVKEMLQNAIDAVRSLGSGSVTVDVDTHAHSITVTDTGTGMSPEIATQALVDIGGTHKTKGSAGGFGIAKVAIFANADDIHVRTTARNPDGSLTQTELKGSGEEWLDVTRGLLVETSTVPADAASAPATGTMVSARLRSDAPFSEYVVSNFLREFLLYHRIPFGLSITINGERLETDPAEVNQLTTLTIPGADIDVFTSPASLKERTGVEVHILNYGIPQFTHRVYLNEAMKVPATVTMNIRSTAGPEHPDYPFRPDRQGLRDAAEKTIDQFVEKNLVVSEAKREAERFKQLIAQAPFIAGTKLRVLSTEENAPPELEPIIKDICASPNMKKLGTMLDRSLKAMQSVVKDTINSTGELFGFGVGTGYLGMNISPESLRGSVSLGAGRAEMLLRFPNNLILINPFLILATAESMLSEREVLEPATSQPQLEDSRAAAYMAGQIVATLEHEMIHDTHRSHMEEFASTLTSALGQLLPVGLRVRRRIQRFLLANDAAVFIELYHYLHRMREAWAGEERRDLFAKIGVSAPVAPRSGDGSYLSPTRTARRARSPRRV